MAVPMAKGVAVSDELPYVFDPTAELAEAERDAARWRWFRERADRILIYAEYDVVQETSRAVGINVSEHRSYPMDAVSVDEAFDAAMAQPEPPAVWADPRRRDRLA